MKTLVIIGAGPAGMAAALAASKEAVGRLNVILIESGREDNFRDHDDSFDLGYGLGGAGLFSDGKFSFYPSGTEVYHLNDKYKIEQGYQLLKEMFLGIGIEIPSLPQEKNNSRSSITSEKKYPSIKTTLEERKKIITFFKGKMNGSILTDTQVSRIIKSDNKYIVYHTHGFPIKADAIIFATGKYGPLYVPQMLKLPSTSKPSIELRYEFGIRIECRASKGDFLNKTTDPDVKHIWDTGKSEVRTFCTCRGGQVWGLSNSELASISGRTEELKKTDYSNFGLLLRFTGKNFLQGKKLWKEVMAMGLVKEQKFMWQSLLSFIDKNEKTGQGIDLQERPWFPKNMFKNGEIHKLIGKELYDLLSTALNKLIELSPDLVDKDTVIIFPAFEGIGSYLKLDNDLNLPGENIWCAGDIVGRFRGLVPSLLSGFYAGLSVAGKLNPTSALEQNSSAALISDKAEEFGMRSKL